MENFSKTSSLYKLSESKLAVKLFLRLLLTELKDDPLPCADSSVLPAKRANAGLCRASISMAIDRVSILGCTYRMLFSILRRRGLSETQVSGSNSTNGIAWLYVRGLP